MERVQYHILIHQYEKSQNKRVEGMFHEQTSYCNSPNGMTRFEIRHLRTFEETQKETTDVKKLTILYLEREQTYDK